jgi:predicted enzyme related to lactoylglutathione lyase
VIIPVGDAEAGARFYSALLGKESEQVSVNRFYFDCGIIVAVVGPGERESDRPLPDYFYFAVDDLEAAQANAKQCGAIIQREIATYPWGERSFYLRDPWDNPLCIVDRATTFTGGRFVD